MIRRAVAVAVGSTLLTGVGAGVCADVQLLGTAVVMGGTGMPTPSQDLVDTIYDVFINPTFGADAYASPLVLTTPEQFSGQSYIDGMNILLGALNNDLRGEDLLVFGVSQSAGLAGMALRQLDPAVVSPEDVRFALLAPPTTPGGIFEQPELHGLMTLLFGADVTAPFPVDTAYNVDVFYGAYDPISDAPPSLWNPITDLNAIIGLATVHGGYTSLTTDQLDTAFLVSQTLTETAYGNGTTSFFMIPTEHLPLLFPVWNTPLEDLLDPLTRLLVNIGYNDLNHGLVDAAGVALPALSPLADPLAVFDAVGTGWTAFLAALGL